MFRGSQTLCHQAPLPEPLFTRGRHRLPLQTEHDMTSGKIKHSSISSCTKALCLHIVATDIQIGTAPWWAILFPPAPGGSTFFRARSQHTVLPPPSEYPLYSTDCLKHTSKSTNKPGFILHPQTKPLVDRRLFSTPKFSDYQCFIRLGCHSESVCSTVARQRLGQRRNCREPQQGCGVSHRYTLTGSKWDNEKREGEVGRERKKNEKHLKKLWYHPRRERKLGSKNLSTQAAPQALTFILLPWCLGQGGLWSSLGSSTKIIIAQAEQNAWEL